MVVILLWGSSQIVERIPPQPVDPNNKANIKDVFYLLFRVGPVFVTFILFLGVYTMSQVQSTMGAYYINYYANRGDMLSWFSMIMMLFSVIDVPCVPFLVKRLHKKGTVMFGLAIAGIGCLMLYLMPTTAITGMMVSRAITGYGYGILMGICWSVITDPVEYADWKTGKRYTAIVMTLVGLGIKFSMIIGGSLPTAVLEAVSYTHLGNDIPFRIADAGSPVVELPTFARQLPHDLRGPQAPVVRLWTGRRYPAGSGVLPFGAAAVRKTASGHAGVLWRDCGHDGGIGCGGLWPVLANGGAWRGMARKNGTARRPVCGLSLIHIYLHGLEAALERGVLFDVFTVLIQRGRADDLHLAPG